jgi:hypothetical protein
MYRWYHNAIKCYVALSDVSAKDTVVISSDESRQRSWELAFRQCRWFTRGWTLQELLAPKSVEFFSSEGRRLGDKTSLEKEIHAITGIPIEAFRGTVPLSSFSIEERLSWASNRRTKRKEDEAYCLLGIFNIYMTFRYGEGEYAMVRLRRKISKLLDLQEIHSKLPSFFI